MLIVFHKVSDERHTLEIRRADGRSEQISCETRSYLFHDLLHYAVESEAGFHDGFWGELASGKTLAELNERTTQSMGEAGSPMLMVEQIVGALTTTMKGRSVQDVVAGLHRNADALSWTIPQWLTPSFVKAVQERMRGLLGRWRSTPFGHSMDLSWPAS